MPMSWIDSYVIATEGLGLLCGPPRACTTQIKLDALRLIPTHGSLLTDSMIDATRWVLSGDASCCAAQLVLNSVYAGSTGKAVSTTTTTAERFSGDFTFRPSNWPSTEGEGFVFFFHKNTAYPLSSGQGYGFEDSNLGTTAGHEGYGVLFMPMPKDGDWDCWNLKLIRDSAANVLAMSESCHYTTASIPGSYDARVDVVDNRLILYFRGYSVLDVTLPFDRTYDGIGFSAASTGSLATTIESLRVTGRPVVDVIPESSPYPPRAPWPLPDSVGNPAPRVNLSWVGGDANGDQVEYEVTFGEKGQTPSPRCDGLKTSSVVPACEIFDLVEGKEYCATVSRKGMADGLAWCFRADRAPYPAQLPSPSSGATGTGYTVNLDWTSGGDPDGQALTHTMLYGTTNPPVAPACVVSEQGVGTTACLVGGLTPYTTYYWQVLSSDGILSTAGPVWSFQTGSNLPPWAPSSPSPYEGHQRAAIAPLLTWAGGDTNIENPTYTVKLGATNPPSETICVVQKPSYDLDAGDVGSCLAPLLTVASVYYWQVTASDGQSTTAGPVWSFRTNTPPTPARNPNPSDGQQRVSVYAELAWLRGTDADGDSLIDTVYMKEGWSGSWTATCVTSGTQTCRPTLKQDTWYYWYVATSDGYESASSNQWSFRTCPPELTFHFCNAQKYQPSGPVPAHGSKQVSPYLAELSWAHKSGIKYTVFFDSVPSPMKVLCLNVPEASCELPRLEFGQTYYWRVDASAHTRSSCCGSINYYSDLRSGPEWAFKTAQYVLTVPSPADGELAVDPYRVRLSWTAPTVPDTETFTVRLDMSTSPTQVACANESSEFCQTFFHLHFGVQYFWQVTAHLPSGDVVGPVWSFRTATCSGAWCPTPFELATLDYYDDASRQACRDQPGVCEAAEDQGLDAPVDAWPGPTDPSEFESLFAPQLGVEHGQGDPGCPEPETNDACSVVFLHGWASDGVETASYESYAELASLFEAKGYIVHKLDYYGGACARTDWPNRLDDTAVYHGLHHKRYANEHEIENDGCDGTGASHNLNTDYRHLAYHVAWFIYDEFSQGGKAVDVVAHSMGGLMIRYAMGATERGEEDWPPYLFIENVVTVASPHGGTKPACGGFWDSKAHWKGYQASQFCRGSEVAKDMMANMRHPNGRQGNTFVRTYWMTMGSDHDWAVIPTSRSVEMDADYKIIHFNDYDRFGNTRPGREECQGDPEYGHSDLHQDFEEVPGDRCIAWMYTGHASYNKDWQAWPWWDKAMRPAPDMYKHSVI